jgi:hypothetical protein
LQVHVVVGCTRAHATHAFSSIELALTQCT